MSTDDESPSPDDLTYQARSLVDGSTPQPHLHQVHDTCKGTGRSQYGSNQIYSMCYGCEGSGVELSPFGETMQSFIKQAVKEMLR
jgi:hypothetical protein